MANKGSTAIVADKPRIVKSDPRISPLIFQYIYYKLMYPFTVNSKYPSKNTLIMKLKNIPFVKRLKIFLVKNLSFVSIISPLKIPTNKILAK